MDAVIVYGSLLHPQDLENVFGSQAIVVPVKLYGFRRCFNQRSDQRIPDATTETVLNATPSENEWLNGLLVSEFDKQNEKEYIERESGYELIPVEPSSIETYPGYDSVSDDLTDIRIASGTLPVENPNPIPEYVAHCIDGAGKWGDQFLTDFLLQTSRT